MRVNVCINVRENVCDHKVGHSSMFTVYRYYICCASRYVGHLSRSTSSATPDLPLYLVSLVTYSTVELTNHEVTPLNLGSHPLIAGSHCTLPNREPPLDIHKQQTNFNFKKSKAVEKNEVWLV